MRKPIVVVSLVAALLAVSAGLLHDLSAKAATTTPAAVQPAPTQERIPTKPYLNMPETADGAMPRLLSQTGAFADVRAMTPAPGLMPYDLILAFWSDGAGKSRYVAIPDGKVQFSADGDWTFPHGTVFVKTFMLPTDTTRPQAPPRRLETRLLVLDRDGHAYGVTYKWRADLSDADLLSADGLDEKITIRDASGQHVQTWAYPSRKDCVTCHNTNTTGQLGPKTRQLNEDMVYPDGTTENQLAHWSRLGLFSTPLNPADIPAYPTLAKATDTSRTLEDRARSFLDANCSQCHRPGGTVANFDARYQIPLARQNLINGPVNIDEGLDHARVISPHDPWRSMIIRRTDTVDDTRMPPIARHTIDEPDVAMLKQYILSLPGRDVLAPPSLLPAGGDFKKPVMVSLTSPDPSAEIHYTLDGSEPASSDPIYDKPIKIDGPTVLRARAIKSGMTNSIVVQQTYLVDN